MKHPVSIVPFANMTPFRVPGPPHGCDFVILDPRSSTTALREGRVLAAPVPVGDLPSLRGLVEPVGNFGVAAAGSLGSVLLFSDLPLDRLVSPARIHLTAQSSSSVRLLFLLLGARNGFDRLPLRITERDGATAELLIGDRALRQAADHRREHVVDLAEAWYSMHRLPFVFARWVIARAAPDDCRAALDGWLRDFADREEEYIEACAGAEAERLGTTREGMAAYLRSMKRVLGEEELRGERLFLRELERHGRDPLFPAAEGVVS